MALPYSRNASHGTQSPISGTTVDALQDCVVGQKKPVMRRVFGANGGGLNPLTPANWNSGSVGISPTQNYMISGAAVSFLVYFPCEVGDRIVGLQARAYGNAVANCSYVAGYLDANSALQQLGQLNDNARAAVWGDAQIGPWTNRTLLADEMLACYVSISGSQYRISKWVVLYDRP